MKKTLMFSIVLLGALSMSGTASALTYMVPCFEWNCFSSPSGTCDFDAGNCSPGGGVYKRLWNFGDGTTYYGGSTTVSHYYPGGHTTNVTLTLYYFSTKPPESTTCSVHYRNVVGPPAPLDGNCDYGTGCNCQ